MAPAPANLSVSMVSDCIQVDGNISLNESESCKYSSQKGDRIPVIVSERQNRVSDNVQRISVRKVLKRNNKFLNAIYLPSVININPRNVYNKAEEFLTFVNQYESDLIFIYNIIYN